MPSLKEVKHRIDSVTSIRKITSAMQMVSSAKLHQAQTALANMLPYEEYLHHLFASLVQEEFYFRKNGFPKGVKPITQSPFLEEREVKHLDIILLASDAGLCGAYNTNMAKMLNTVLEEYKDLPRENITIYPIGKKLYSVAKATGCSVSYLYARLADHPNYDDCASLSRRIGMHFLRGSLDKVELLYYHFKSMSVQQLYRSTFLPIPIQNVTLDNPSFGRELKGKQGVVIPTEEFGYSDFDSLSDVIIEPSRQALMDALLPKVLRFQLYRAVLDAKASEHAARTIAMKVASDNADHLIDDLTLQYNKSRQMAITNELLDIAGGSLYQ